MFPIANPAEITESHDLSTANAVRILANTVARIPGSSMAKPNHARGSEHALANDWSGQRVPEVPRLQCYAPFAVVAALALPSVVRWLSKGQTSTGRCRPRDKFLASDAARHVTGQVIHARGSAV